MTTFAVGMEVKVSPSVFDGEHDLLDVERDAFMHNDFIGVIKERVVHAIEPSRCWRVESGGQYLFLKETEIATLDYRPLVDGQTTLTQALEALRMTSELLQTFVYNGYFGVEAVEEQLQINEALLQAASQPTDDADAGSEG